jgi:phosphoribosylformimino-5-aminoimidazole carboxamide ribotide isomerase
VIVLQVWAAIDLRRGRVVSLRKGNPANGVTWSSNPLAIAVHWEREGAAGLHVIDLDGAFCEGSNLKTIELISRNSGIPVQVGGGIRSIAQAKALLHVGVSRIVLGTIAYDAPSIMKKAVRTLGSGKILAALDYRNDTVVTNGWTRETSLNVPEAVDLLESSGIETVLATAVEFDGTGLGPDIKMLRKLCGSTRMKILASGGIRNLEDIRELKRIGLHGAVVGKALYEGTVCLNTTS